MRVRAVRIYQQAMNYLIRKEGIEEKSVLLTSDGENGSPIIVSYNAIHPPYETYKAKRINLKV